MAQNNIDISDSQILIVDDNPSNLALLFNYLSKKGFRVVAADSGETALKLLKENKPDLILLDVVMPEIDGYQVCRVIKDEPDLMDIPVIFLSAVTTHRDKIRAFDAGGVDYITKPFQHEELAARVNSHLMIKHQQNRMKELNSLLKESNDRKDRLFSIISHDLRSPLSTILGYSEIIQEDFDELSSDEIKEYNGHIHNVSKEINGLISNLLDWSRIQLDRIDFQPEPVNLCKAAQKAIKLLNDNAQFKDIKINSFFDGKCIAYADSNMIHTILRNLVSNAIKFTQAGGEVNISVKDSNGSIEVAIADTGIGMTSDEVKSIFEDSNKQPRLGTNNERGTGLGLLLCKDFIKRNSGNIVVESKSGVGSKFSFSIPAEEQS